MKSIILMLILAALIGLLVWQYKTIPITLENHQKKVQELSESKALAEQQQCHDQAHARFALLGLEGQPSETFKSHYNTTLGKCFLQIENTTSSLDIVWKNVTVFDAATGGMFGSYSWHSIPGQKPADVAPFTCEVTLPSADKKDCTSETEFRSLIEIYMK